MPLETQPPTDHSPFPEWESSLGRQPESLPDPLRRVMYRLCRPRPGDRPDHSTGEIVDDALLAWRIRGEFALNGQVEDVVIRRGVNMYYVRFRPDGIMTDRAPITHPPDYDPHAKFRQPR